MSQSGFSATDYLVEILEQQESGECKPLGSGVVVGENVVASVRHVLEIEDDKFLDKHQVVISFRGDGKPEIFLKVTEIIRDEEGPDSLVLIRVAHSFDVTSIAHVRPSRDAFGDDVVFCGYPERTSRASTYIGRGSLAPGGAAVPGSEFHWAQINTQDVYRGMSGGPVFLALNGDLVALISERATVGDQSGRGPSYCLALNAGRLWHPRFGLEDKELGNAAGTRRDQQLAHDLSISDLIHVTSDNVEATNVVNFVGREDIQGEVAIFLQGAKFEDDSIFQVLGIGGIGKTSLLEKVRSNIENGEIIPSPDFQIYHSFDDDRTIEGFVETLRSRAPKQLTGLSFPEIVDRYLELLVKKRGLVILDAVENVQSRNSDDNFGNILDPELRRFIDFFDGQVKSKLIISSRQLVPFGEKSNKRMRSTKLDSLAPEQSVELYRSILNTEPPLAWNELCAAVENHPGALATVLYQAKNTGRKGLAWALDTVRGKEPKDGYIEIIRSIAEELTPDQQSIMYVICQLDDEVELKQLGEILENVDIAISDELFTGISPNELPEAISRLVDVALLEYTQAEHVSAHNIVKEFFSGEFLALDVEQQKRIQRRIAHSFKNRFGADFQHKDMATLRPGLDTVVHLCKAKDYVAAARYLDIDVQNGPGREFIVSNRLGGITDLKSTIAHFYPDGDINSDPFIPHGEERDTVLHYSGYCQSVQGGYPDMALTKLEEAAHGAASRRTYDIALDIFRAASYSAVSAGNLKKAMELLEKAETIAVIYGNKDESLKLLVQMTVTSHMTLGTDWKAKAIQLTNELEKIPDAKLSELISRNSLYVAFLSRTGHARSADRLQKEILRPLAARRGWTDIVWRYLSFQATISEGYSSRLAAFETAVSTLSKHHRIDLKAEVANRCARYLIAENRAEDIDTDAKLRNWTSDLNLENYPLLKLDLEVTTLAAQAAKEQHTVEWEKLEEKARARSYSWAINDIRRYRKDLTCRLV